jgi:hypothetical protein
MNKLSGWLERASEKKFLRILINPIFLFTVYRIGLDISYRFILSPIWGYAGYTYSFQFWRWIGLLFVSVLVYALVSENKRTVSTMFIELMLWMAYAPFACFYALSGKDITFFIFMSICFVVIRLTLSLFEQVKTIHIKRYFSFLMAWALHNRKILRYLCFWGTVGICLLVSALTVVALVLYVDASNWRVAFDLIRVYEIRLTADLLPLWASYIVMWQAKVINIFLACLLFRHRKYWMIVFPVIFQIVLYFCLANKFDLFLLALCLFILLSLRIKRCRSIFGATFFLGVAGVTILTFMSSSGILLYSMFDRAFFGQATLSYEYFNFFSNHTKLFFSEGRLGSLLGLEYPYPINSAKIIMAHVYGGLDGGANGFFLSSGFSDMGFAGMLIVSILLSLILVYLDKVCYKIPLWFTMTALVASITFLINAHLFTTLLTGGLLLCTLLLTLYGAYESLSQNRGSGTSE